MKQYDGNIEGCLSLKRYNKTARCFYGVIKRRLNYLDVLGTQ